MSDRPLSPGVVSPTTMVLNYLSTKGIKPTSANVREAINAANANPGLIPGLVTDRPATDAEDRAAMAAARQTRKGGGGGRKQPNSGDTFFPNGVPTQQTASKDDTFFPGGTNTSGAGAGGDNSIDSGIYGWLIPAILGTTAGGYALKQMFGGRGGQNVSGSPPNAERITPQSTADAMGGASEYAGNVPPNFRGRTIDVNPTGITGDQRQGIIFEEDQPSTTSKAIDRAVGGEEQPRVGSSGSATKQIEGGGTPSTPSTRTSSTIVDPWDLPAAGANPPGISNIDMANAGLKGAGEPPRVPLISSEPRTGIVPPNIEDLVKQIFRLGIR